MVAQQAQAPEAMPALELAIIEHHRKLQESGTPPSTEEYTRVCENCLQLFKARNKNSGLQRTSYEYEVLRRVLMISDPTRLPVFCDTCYEQAIVPGQNRQIGYPNLVLEKLGVQPARD